MEMLWSDLMPGDYIKISKEYRKKYCMDELKWDNTLLVKEVTVDYNGTIYITFVITKVKEGHRFYIYQNGKDNTYVGAPVVFDIIELVKD